MNNALKMVCFYFFVFVKNSVENTINYEKFDYDYCDIFCNGTLHTMCKFPAGGGQDCDNNLKVYLTREEKVYIEDNLNRMRLAIALGNKDLPMASNMMKLVWDNELAAIAKRWADQCTQPMHDKCRLTGDEMETGQTAFIGRNERYAIGNNKLSRIKMIMEAWENEMTLFNQDLINSYNTSEDNIVGNFTQIIWGITEFVGCGYTEFQMQGYVLSRMICNFKRKGDVDGAKVYRKGKPCSACPYTTRCSETNKGMCWNGKFSNYNEISDSACLQSPFASVLISLVVLAFYV